MALKPVDDFFDVKPQGETPQENLLNLIGDYKTGAAPEIVSGTKVKGTILRTGAEFTFVDLGGKNEAVIKSSDLLDSTGAISVKPGDVIDAYVTSASDGEIILSKALSAGAGSGTRELIDAMRSGIPVQGKVTGINKGGFNVKVLGQRAFCPMSQISLSYVEDPTTFLNQSLSFVITKVEENGRNIVVSRDPILEDEVRILLDRVTKNIDEKETILGKVTRVAPFGLFVDIGGIEGLVHISEVAWTRSENLSEEFSIGQQVSVVVLKIEQKVPLRQSKISLSIKHASEDPWNSVSEKFAPGTMVDGTITRLMPFGAFVEIAAGIEGLIHVSEMSWTKRINHPSEVVQPGQIVSVTIVAVDEAKRSVSCSLKAEGADPWSTLPDNFKLGGIITGTIARQSKFGYFVDLADGITGLLTPHHIATDKKGAIKIGGQIDVTIDAIDLEKRRIALSFGVASDTENEADAKEYLQMQNQAQVQKKETVAAAPQASAFSDALKAAIEKKSKK